MVIDQLLVKRLVKGSHDWHWSSSTRWINIQQSAYYLKLAHITGALSNDESRAILNTRTLTQNTEDEMTNATAIWLICNICNIWLTNTTCDKIDFSQPALYDHQIHDYVKSNVLMSSISMIIIWSSSDDLELGSHTQSWLGPQSALSAGCTIHKLPYWQKAKCTMIYIIWTWHMFLLPFTNINKHRALGHNVLIHPYSM